MTRARDLADSADKDIAGTLTLDDLSVSGTADVTGDLTVDTDTLYVDTTNDRVGIGTSSPEQELHVFAANAGQNADVRIEGAGGATDYLDVFHGPDDCGLWSLNSSNPLVLGTNNTTRLSIDASGRITTPYQPAFFCRPPNGYAVSSDTIIAGSWSEVYDVGNNFNNGTFTAPVSGKYYITWSALVSTNDSRLDFYLTVNDSDILRSEVNGYSTSQTNRSGAVSGLLSLAANDYVKFGIRSNSGSPSQTYSGSNSPWGNACGFLVG